MTTSLLALVAVAMGISALLTMQRNYLTLAETQRHLAETWRLLNRPEEAEEAMRKAVNFERLAWPFKSVTMKGGGR